VGLGVNDHAYGGRPRRTKALDMLCSPYTATGAAIIILAIKLAIGS
jgi:hypothetical protein